MRVAELTITTSKRIQDGIINRRVAANARLEMSDLLVHWIASCCRYCFE
jgi:hypothetical protein